MEVCRICQGGGGLLDEHLTRINLKNEINSPVASSLEQTLLVVVTERLHQKKKQATATTKN